MDIAKVKFDDSVLKLIMYIVIVVVIIYYLNRFITGTKDALGGVFGSSPEQKKQQLEDASKGIANAKITGSDGSVSYKRETFINLAQKLQDANSRLIFDSQAVKDVFNLMRSLADVKFLIQVYGIKNGLNLIQYLKGIIPRENYIGLSLNDLNNILKRKGIKYAF